MSDACMVSNQYEEGLAYTNQAIPYLEQSGDLYELMNAYNHRGVFLYMLNRVEESIDSFQDALSLGADSHDPHVWRARANAHYQIAVVRVLGGWPETAQMHAQRSLADYTVLGRTSGQTTAYSALAIAHYLLGNYPQALQESQLGIEMAKRAQAWRMLGYLHAYRGMIELAIGNIDTAVENAERAIELGERYKHEEITSAGYRITGDLYFWLGEPHKSLENYRLATKAGQDQFLWNDTRFRLGFAQVLCGQVEIGKEIVEEVISLSDFMGLGFVALEARLSKLYIHRYLNEWQPARLLARQLDQDAIQRSIPTIRLSASNALGELAIQDGDPLTAVEYFQGTAKSAAKLLHPWIEIQSLTMLHNALNLANCPDPAPRRQIEHLLEQIAKNVRKDSFKLRFKEYRQQILQLLQ
jgi:tetratricopeptide (TPR) repeat protein